MKKVFAPIIFILTLSFGAEAKEEIQATKHLESIVLGSGCFWGEEKRYEAISGVVEAVSGYADGRGVLPNYREITKIKNKFNPNNHAEVVLVVFNRNIVSAEDILKHYFEGHDPTQVNRQGNDIGTQYRSVILTTNNQQNVIAKKLLDEFQVLMSKHGYGKIVTKIKQLEKFYYAEDYHQDYLVKNPNGYCPDHSTGLVFKENKNFVETDNTLLLKGKQIVVIESESCPYCAKFRKDV
ncbi:uncharacterized protein METZ01_LOCUS425503, partial [marine metagenome]